MWYKFATELGADLYEFEPDVKDSNWFITSQPFFQVPQSKEPCHLPIGLSLMLVLISHGDDTHTHTIHTHTHHTHTHHTHTHHTHTHTYIHTHTDEGRVGG